LPLSYRESGADPPFADPARDHGAAMEGYYWRLVDAKAEEETFNEAHNVLFKLDRALPYGTSGDLNSVGNAIHIQALYAVDPLDRLGRLRQLLRFAVDELEAIQERWPYEGETALEAATREVVNSNGENEEMVAWLVEEYQKRKLPPDVGNALVALQTWGMGDPASAGFSAYTAFSMGTPTMFPHSVHEPS